MGNVYHLCETAIPNSGDTTNRSTRLCHISDTKAVEDEASFDSSVGTKNHPLCHNRYTGVERKDLPPPLLAALSQVTKAIASNSFFRLKDKAVSGLQARARTRSCPTKDRLIQIDVAISDFNVVAAIRVSTNPSLVVNGCSLTTKIRKRH